MIASLADVIGSRGEDIVELALTDYNQIQRPLFAPAFLGDKWPALDFYVELNGVRNCRPIFFAQVKSTSAKLGKSSKSLRVSISKSRCEALFRVPGPTYVIGVHEPSRRVFIASVHSKPSKGVYNIPVSYELTPGNLKKLYQEVRDYWLGMSRKPLQSAFTI